MKRPLKQCFDEQGNFILRPYRLIDLANAYGVCTRTLTRWLKNKIPERTKKTTLFFQISEVSAIINALGIPSVIGANNMQHNSTLTQAA
jgi:hypothetical protein